VRPLVSRFKVLGILPS